MQLRWWTGADRLEHRSTNHHVGVPAESDNPGMLAVGAAAHSTPTVVRDTSNKGPTVKDSLKKPDIVGATCVSTATDGFNGFCGTSAAAPHVAGMAALVLARYDEDDNYAPKDVADWLKDTAAQRITATDPNNTWGHGFAMLPDPAPTAKFTTPPLSITEGYSSTFRVAADPPNTNVRVVVNDKGDTGKLSLSGACPDRLTTGAAAWNGSSITLKGCSAGPATVRLYKDGTNVLLRVYKVTVAASTSTVMSIHRLDPALTVGENDAFHVAASGLTPGVPYTLKVATPNNSTGFNSSCTTSKLLSIRPGTADQTVSMTLYACNTSRGTVTAELRRGGVSGPVVATSTFGVTVTAKPTASLSPVPATLAMGQSKTFTVATNILSPGFSVRVNDLGDSGNLSLSNSCPSFTGVGAEYGNGTSVTIKGCVIGTAKVGLYKGDALVKSYTITVTDPDIAELSPAPSTITKDSSVTYTLNTPVSGNLRIIVNRAGDTGNLSYTSSCPGASDAQYFRSNGQNLTLKGCTAGSVKVDIYKDLPAGSNPARKLLKSYTVTVNSGTGTTTSQAPTSYAGPDQTVARGSTVRLHGMGSPYDPDQDVYFSWTQEPGGTRVSLRNAHRDVPYTSGLSGDAVKFTAPSTAGKLMFKFTVTDASNNLSTSDLITVTVR